jgi:V-type H+-transporting ATPase subunit a
MTWLAGKTRWVCDANDATKGCDSQYVAGLERNGTYAFGVDPIWRGSKSELPFLNSMKMKMSIIMGVTQMMVGIFMSLLNFVRAKDVLSIACECIPQVIFLGALFGYLVFLIVLKWITPGCEADLYHVLIYMFLDPGNVDCAGEGPGGTAGCPENVMFRGQGVLQVCLVVVAFASVPVMLLPKPLVLKRRHDARARGEAYARLPGEDEDGEAFNFGDVFVHQMIHTIEFVLGAVSNTASYLRLWALSLAHSQLSAVFLDRVLMASAATKSPLVMLVGFAVWAVATIGVLMLMESLSAFLHALRLHWVEYQNKFYKGDGYAFDPFSFESILKEAAAEGS